MDGIIKTLWLNASNTAFAIDCCRPPAQSYCDLRTRWNCCAFSGCSRL